MSRIGATDRLGPARALVVIPDRGTAAGPGAARRAEDLHAEDRPAARRLVAVEGDRGSRAGSRRDGRPDPGFVAQLLVANDPTLRPTRIERTRAAAALYAEAARRIA